MPIAFRSSCSDEGQIAPLTEEAAQNPEAQTPRSDYLCCPCQWVTRSGLDAKITQLLSVQLQGPASGVWMEPGVVSTLRADAPEFIPHTYNLDLCDAAVPVVFPPLDPICGCGPRDDFQGPELSHLDIPGAAKEPLRGNFHESFKYDIEEAYRATVILHTKVMLDERDMQEHPEWEDVSCVVICRSGRLCAGLCNCFRFLDVIVVDSEPSDVVGSDGEEGGEGASVSGGEEEGGTPEF